MKSVFFAAALLLMLVITGCTELRLANGVYVIDTPGREDMATVYGNLIFLRLRNAEDDSMNNGYWDWAGKFKIVDAGTIALKMDRKTKRNWDFYYDLTMRGNAIIVDDLRAEKSYTLKWRPAVSRPQYNQNIQPMGGNTSLHPLPAYQ